MAAPLKQLAKQSLAGAKKRVRLHPLSADEAVAVVFTVLKASPAPLFRAVAKSKVGRSVSSSRMDIFANIIRSILDYRHGSVYAAIVTAIDADDVFHSDRFAVSLKRLGVMDDIGSKLDANGFDAVSELVVNKAPYFWAELSAGQLEIVVKEMGGTFNRLIKRFAEDLEPEEIDVLLEAQALKTPVSSLAPRLQFLHGASQLNMGQGQSAYTLLTRRMAANPNIVLLDDGSSIEGVFTSFHQHLLTNMAVLQRLVPKTSFGGQTYTVNEFQKIFKDSQVIRRLKMAFLMAYNERSHSVDMTELYRTIKRTNFYSELKRASSLYSRVRLDDNGVSALTNAIIGLFFAFAGDAKGQSLPFMPMIKKR